MTAADASGGTGCGAWHRGAGLRPGVRGRHGDRSGRRLVRGGGPQGRAPVAAPSGRCCCTARSAAACGRRGGCIRAVSTQRMAGAGRWSWMSRLCCPKGRPSGFGRTTPATGGASRSSAAHGDGTTRSASRTPSGRLRCWSSWRGCRSPSGRKLALASGPSSHGTGRKAGSSTPASWCAPRTRKASSSPPAR